MTQRFLRRPEVEQITGLPRSTLYDLIAANQFPKPVSISTHTVAWIDSEVAEWQNQRIAKRDSNTKAA